MFGSAAGHMAKCRALSGLVRDAGLVRRVVTSGSPGGVMNQPSKVYSGRMRVLNSYFLKISNLGPARY